MFTRLMGLDRISPDTLHRRMQNSEAVTVIDVTSRSSWTKAHVPGATNLAPTDHGADGLPADKSVDLVFYCSNATCRKAPTAAGRARKMGYTSVRVMSAGISGWLAAKLPTDSGA